MSPPAPFVTEPSGERPFHRRYCHSGALRYCRRLGSADEQDRAGRDSQDLLRNAAHQRVRDTSATVCAHDDQISVAEVRVAHDLFGRGTNTHGIFRSQPVDGFNRQE